MNCGICAAYFGYTLKDTKRNHPCLGCRSRKNLCAFIKKPCTRLSRNQVEYCFECTDFPCENLKKLDRRYREKFAMSMIDNLRFIQINGIDKFLENEKGRWRCPSCGGVVCVHNKKCYSCGAVRIAEAPV
jgi:hypothetical protein